MHQRIHYNVSHGSWRPLLHDPGVCWWKGMYHGLMREARRFYCSGQSWIDLQKMNNMVKTSRWPRSSGIRQWPGYHGTIWSWTSRAWYSARSCWQEGRKRESHFPVWPVCIVGRWVKWRRLVTNYIVNMNHGWRWIDEDDDEKGKPCASLAINTENLSPEEGTG